MQEINTIILFLDAGKNYFLKSFVPDSIRLWNFFKGRSKRGNLNQFTPQTFIGRNC